MGKEIKNKKKRNLWLAEFVCVVVVGVVGLMIYSTVTKEKEEQASTAGYDVDAFIQNLNEELDLQESQMVAESIEQSLEDKIKNRQNKLTIPDWITEDWITVNEYSRPGEALPEVNAIVVHYVGNAGTTAAQNRSYFQGLAEKKDEKEKRSSHFIVGLEGEIIQCIPINEICYAANERNSDSISIEVCHPDSEGEFSEVTYHSLVRLISWLCENLNLTSENVIRHYDITGKLCPLYYVKNPEKWDQLLADVAAYMEENPDIQ
ncbi:MAG: N-acetylmuramoyl-L-alanine amidase family protein [Lachnospiraceae bacterium]